MVGATSSEARGSDRQKGVELAYQMVVVYCRCCAPYFGGNRGLRGRNVTVAQFGHVLIDKDILIDKPDAPAQVGIYTYLGT